MEPKLYESLKYGGDCPLCGEEVPPGTPGWVYEKKAWCASHRREDIIEASKVNTDALRTPSDAMTPPLNEKLVLEWFDEVSRQLTRIANQLEIIAGRLQK